MTSPNPSGSARRLAAILSADVAGYARLMEADEEETFARLGHSRDILMRRIGQHDGRVANTAGDAVLAEFASAVDAVRCAIAAQEELSAANSAVPADKRLDFRIGLHVGDVIMRAGDIFGDSVNIAARLQGMATPGGITLSASAYEQVKKPVPVHYVDQGLQHFKNIAEPVRAYAIDNLTRPVAPAAPGYREALPIAAESSVAVLPFANMSGDAEQEYFSDGITEDIITALSRFKWFFVIARNSSFAYKGRNVDIRQIGRELGVRYVLEGSVRKSGTRLRITGQLIEAENGRHIWAEKYDGDLSDVFDLQDQITESVVGAIEPELRAAEITRALEKRTPDLTSYDLYLRAIPLCMEDATPEQNRAAIGLLRQALVIDPDYVRAKGALIAAYLYLLNWQLLTREDEEVLRSLTQDVLATRTDDAETVSLTGLALAMLGEPEDGAALTDQALSLNPNLQRVLTSSAFVAMYNGVPKLAVEKFEKARRLSPHSSTSRFATTNLGMAYILLQEFEMALATGRAAMLVAPLNPTGRRVVISSLAHLGRLDEARAEAAKLMAIMPHFRIGMIRRFALGRADAKLGSPYVNGLVTAGLPE
jgi:adenylate cyclase